MTRDEAIEAGARALWDHLHNREGAPEYPWDLLSESSQDVWRERVAAVLDAIGWAEPDCDHIWERELSSEWATCARCGAKVTWPTWSGPMRYGAPDTPDQQRLANAAGG